MEEKKLKIIAEHVIQDRSKGLQKLKDNYVLSIMQEYNRCLLEYNIR